MMMASSETRRMSMMRQSSGRNCGCSTVREVWHLSGTADRVFDVNVSALRAW
jgi:hypothetical protein